MTYDNICELENAACLSPDKNIKKRSQGECDQGKGPKHLLHCRQCKTKKEGVEFRIYVLTENCLQWCNWLDPKVTRHNSIMSEYRNMYDFFLAWHFFLLLLTNSPKYRINDWIFKWLWDHGGYSRLRWVRFGLWILSTIWLWQWYLYSHYQSLWWRKRYITPQKYRMLIMKWISGIL